MTFINSDRRIKWTTPFKEIFCDLDGSLTTFTNGWATPYYKWNEWTPACVHDTSATSTYDGGIVCDGSVVLRRLQLSYVNPRELDFQVRTCVP